MSYTLQEEIVSNHENKGTVKAVLSEEGAIIRVNDYVMTLEGMRLKQIDYVEVDAWGQEVQWLQGREVDYLSHMKGII